MELPGTIQFIGSNTKLEFNIKQNKTRQTQQNHKPIKP
jgi:hypothetical protein